MTSISRQDFQKRQAGEAAVAFIESGMIVGLGHGSTAIWTLRLLGQKINNGELKDIIAVPCSTLVEKNATQAGIPVTPFKDIPVIDLTIDGADEVDPQLNLIKGRGGALLREKIVAQASTREIIVVDGSKQVTRLGSTRPVPVELLPFGSAAQLHYLESLGARVSLRRSGQNEPLHTDQGNYLADCHFDSLEKPGVLSEKLDCRAGVVGHGLFLDLATDIIMADEDGLHHLTKKDQRKGL